MAQKFLNIMKCLEILAQLYVPPGGCHHSCGNSESAPEFLFIYKINLDDYLLKSAQLKNSWT